MTIQPPSAYLLGRSGPSPGLESTALPTSDQSKRDTWISAIELSPNFQIIAALLQAGQDLKNQSIELLKSKSGELDPKTMAYFNEFNEQANQLMTIATNMQKSDQNVREAFVRNMV
ncbi:MAG: hypothetical protein KTR25_15820 [Myxococcales bacterium]|nr:hypothetical protein [Myxococcales bacterium]